MRGHRIGCTLLMLLALQGAPARAGALHLTTEESPPAAMLVGGRLVGVSADKVRAMFARAGAAYTLDVLPWARAYDLALRQPDTCVFSTTRTTEREALFKWVGPITRSEWVLYRRESQALPLASLEDARRYRIGVYHADVRESYLRARGFDVDTAPDDQANLRKLLAGRIDLWAADRDGGRMVMRRAGLSHGVVPALTFNRVELYLACNPAVPDAMLDRLAQALQGMERDGTAQAIDRLYAALPPSAVKPRRKSSTTRSASSASGK